jgi:hypothetical protein
MPTQHLHCVTCWQPLPEGKEPDYFASTSLGWTAEQEAERAAEDVSCCLRYAQSINSALWDMLQVAAVESPKLPDKEHYLEGAKSLCALLVDLVGETERRVDLLSTLVAEQARKAGVHNG